MRIKTILLAASAMLAMTSASFAACVNYPIITPDNAPVNRSEVVGVAGGGGGAAATAYTIATFCPVKAAKGTCTGQSLSEKVSNHVRYFTTLDGVVADIERHKNGFYIPLPGPDLFIPTTGYLPGAC